MNDLNLDPRNRSAAGMGTQVVQEERTPLMASAWQQVDGVRKANELLHQAQLARATLQQIHACAIQAGAAGNLDDTDRAVARAAAGQSTQRSSRPVRTSRVPERHAVRHLPPRHATAHGGLVHRPTQRPALLSRVNSGDVAIVPDAKPPGGMVSIDTITKNFVAGWVKALAKYRRWILLALLLLASAGGCSSRRLGRRTSAAVAAVVVAVAAGAAAAVVHD